VLDNNYTWKEPEVGDTSIQNEDRFETMKQSRASLMRWAKGGAAKALSTAFDKVAPIQLYTYARGLQRQGNAKRAFELYPLVPKKDATTGSAPGARSNCFNSSDFATPRRR